METCTKQAWRRKLTAYVDRELPPERAVEIEMHLETCARCRREVALDLRIAHALHALPAWEAPASVTEAVIARTIAVPHTGHRRLVRWLPALRIAVPSCLVLALLVVLKLTGIIPAAVSFASVMTIALVRDVHGVLANARDVLGPVAKAVELGHADRIFVDTARAIFAAPPVELALAGILTMLILVLGVRLLVSRSPRGVGHAALFS